MGNRNEEVFGVSSALAQAYKIKGAVIVLHEAPIEGKIIFQTSCVDYDAWQALPACVTYKRLTFVKTGWNSDTGRACYQQSTAFAVPK